VVPQHAPGGNVPRPAGYALPVRPDMRLCPLPLAGHRPAEWNIYFELDGMEWDGDFGYRT